MKEKRKLYLRESRARYPYTCAICTSLIRRGMTYYRDEPFPMARIKGEAEIRHLCLNCVIGKDPASLVVKPRINGTIHSTPSITQDGQQLALSFGEEAIIHKTRVLVVNVTSVLVDRIFNDYNEIYNISPEDFEYLIHDRIYAMGLEAQRTGHSFRKDGGIDIIFYPPQHFPMPFLGAVQLKHHSSAQTKTGPAAIREMAGVMSTHPFQIGLVVTNTTFTADAEWYAKHERVLIRLRDMYDLKRWIASNFTDEAEWREIPSELELCPGVTINLNRRITRRPQNV